MLITDGQAFEKLFREHYLLLCNYAGKYIIDSQVREDIVQVFFISILSRALSRISFSTATPASRSIKNSCINYYKSEIIKDNSITTLTEEWKSQLNEEEDFIYQQEVQQALHKLPEKCRKVFLLKCISELKYKEIAEICDISTNTVKYHLGEAFRIMRNELKDLQWTWILLFYCLI